MSRTDAQKYNAIVRLTKAMDAELLDLHCDQSFRVKKRYSDVVLAIHTEFEEMEAWFAGFCEGRLHEKLLSR